MLINHASADPRFAEHPGHKLHGIQSYIAVPLNRRDGTYFGTLCAFDLLPAELTDEIFEVFHLLASLIAYELEAEDVEHQASEEAERLAAQGKHLARLEERDRIAMDLHDGVIQSLYGVVLRLGAQELSADPAEQDEVKQAIAQLNEVIQEIRRNILNLRLRDLGERGLRTGIERLVEELRQHMLVQARVEVTGDIEGAIDEDAWRSLLYIAREATSNVIRHAGATKVTLRVVHARDHLVISIRDNGRGFFKTGLTLSPNRGVFRGNGMRNIAERARLIGGTATVDSHPGKGTTVRIRVPLKLNAEGGA